MADWCLKVWAIHKQDESLLGFSTIKHLAPSFSQVIGPEIWKPILGKHLALSVTAPSPLARSPETEEALNQANHEFVEAFHQRVAGGPITLSDVYEVLIKTEAPTRQQLIVSVSDSQGVVKESWYTDLTLTELEQRLEAPAEGSSSAG